MPTHKFFVTILILSLSGLLFLSGLTVVASAQEPAPFEISVIPQADQATAGEPFTYTVTITNVGETLVDTTVITVDVPEGTNFVNTRHLSEKWYGGNALPDPDIEIEEIILYTAETIQAAEVFSFSMIVNVDVDVENEIAIEDYGIITEKDGLSASGPPVQVKVSSPTPTFTPIIPPTPTSTYTPTPSPTNSEVPTPTPPLNSRENTVTPSPTLQNLSQATANEWSGQFFLIGGVSFILFIIGIIWFLRKR